MRGSDVATWVGHEYWVVYSKIGSFIILIIYYFINKNKKEGECTYIDCFCIKKILKCGSANINIIRHKWHDSERFHKKTMSLHTFSTYFGS